MSTSVFLHNLNPEETNTVYSKLQDPSNTLFTIHPLFIALITFDLLFQVCLRDLGRLFFSQISLERDLGLGPYVRRHHYQNPNIDNKTAFDRAFSDGKALCGLEERMDYNVVMGRKLLSYFDEIDAITPGGPGRASFEKAGNMIKIKLEYLVESLELQFPRLRRAKANNQLNRTGVTKYLSPSLPSHFTPPKLTTHKVRNPSHNPNKQPLLPNRLGNPLRLQRHESHRRPHHALPPRHLPRFLLRDATV